MRKPGIRLGRGTGPLVAALLVVAASACGESFGLFNVEGVREIEPRTVWFEWYQDVEACAGTDGNFTRVNWYRADAIVNSDTDEKHDGLFRPPHDIFLVRGRQASEFTVRHEMVHELLGLRDPDHTHSHPAFDRCVAEAIQRRGAAGAADGGPRAEPGTGPDRGSG